jgi:hypothetical protein
MSDTPVNPRISANKITVGVRSGLSAVLVAIGSLVVPAMLGAAHGPER